MSRIRSIKPEMWASEDFLQLSLAGRLAWLFLIGNADDEGRIKTSARHLNLVAVPEGGGTAEDMSAQIDVMVGRGMIDFYEVNGATYAQICNWQKHQRIDRPSLSSNPAPPRRRTLVERSSNTRRGLVEHSSNDRRTIAQPPDPLREDSSNVRPSRAGVDQIRSDQIRSDQRGSDQNSLSPAPVGADVEGLCDELADLIERNGTKRPTVSQQWLKEADLLLRRDKVSLEDARRVMRWCQEDSFWRSNILSMPKFRQKFPQLRLKADVVISLLPSRVEAREEYLRQLRTAGGSA